MEMAFVHPNWTGNVESGFDVALVRLPREIDVPTPVLSNPDVHPNSRTFAFNLASNLLVAKFDVVEAKLCPMLHTMTDRTICVFSSGASMQPGTLC